MNLLCPACHTPLPADADAVVACATCAAEVDVTRAGTISGRPRFVPELDRTGTDVGGYRIESRLGGGGMGTVYRATADDGTPVAVKFLAPALADNPDVVARFAREIATLTRLEHPAIVRVLAHGTQDGTPWFAMALVEGSDLRARIAKGALPPAETAGVFGRLFAALAHAHERGVVHRDLKPANVLLGADGARLADFGIAHLEAELLTGPMVTRLTETAAVLGTLPYMSPEQRRGGAVDRRSDLFSAGVMLYEAATGILPQGAFAPPSELNRVYGRAFDRIVMHLLQADSARRPAAAAAVGTTLAAALAPRRRRPIAIAASIGVLVLTLGGGTLGLRAMFRQGGNAEKEAVVSVATVAKETPKAPPAAPDKQAPAPATEEEGLTKLLGPEADEKQRPRGKIKRKVVLKAVADVKKLRAAATKAPRAKPASTKSARTDGKKSKVEFSDDMFAPVDADGGPPAPLPPRK
ncbi:MAG TPA: serine/threonine-protein kinase [Polyangia bacterium]|nr:serine/threonine-protein kinase [Polyangia bacterium]